MDHPDVRGLPAAARCRTLWRLVSACALATLSHDCSCLHSTSRQSTLKAVTHSEQHFPFLLMTLQPSSSLEVRYLSTSMVSSSQQTCHDAQSLFSLAVQSQHLREQNKTNSGERKQGRCETEKTTRFILTDIQTDKQTRSIDEAFLLDKSSKAKPILMTSSPAKRPGHLEP